MNPLLISILITLPFSFNSNLDNINKIIQEQATNKEKDNNTQHVYSEYINPIYKDVDIDERKN